METDVQEELWHGMTLFVEKTSRNEAFLASLLNICFSLPKACLA
jgi:hypothetical protein